VDSARRLGEQFLSRRRLRSWAILAAGIALVVGGFAGFGHYGDKVDAVRKTGIHTSGTVTQAVLYRGRGDPNGFREHIDVQYVLPDGGVERGVRIWIGEQDRFRVGELVPIVYDPKHPHTAVLADRKGDIGPIGAPFFIAIVAGAMLAWFGVRGWRLARGGRRALCDEPRRMSATILSVQRGRRRVPLCVLAGSDGTIQFSPVSTRDWSPLPSPVEVDVFGGEAPGSVVVVVDMERPAATAGRLPRARRRLFGTRPLTR